MAKTSKEEEQRREGVVALAKLGVLAVLYKAEQDFGAGLKNNPFRKQRTHARIVEEAIVAFAKPAGRKPKAKAEVAT